MDEEKITMHENISTKPILPMYILQKRTFICCPKLFFLNNSSDISLGTKSEILEQEHMVSMQKYTEQLHLLSRVELFLWLQGFAKSFLPYKFLWLIFVDIFGKYSLFHLLSRSSKERLVLFL